MSTFYSATNGNGLRQQGTEVTCPTQYFHFLTLCLWALHGKNRLVVVLGIVAPWRRPWPQYTTTLITDYTLILYSVYTLPSLNNHGVPANPRTLGPHRILGIRWQRYRPSFRHVTRRSSVCRSPHLSWVPGWCLKAPARTISTISSPTNQTPPSPVDHRSYSDRQRLLRCRLSDIGT